MVGLFVGGFWLTATSVDRLDVAGRFEDVRARFDVWVGVIGAVGGLALASALWFGVALARIRHLFVGVRKRTVVGWIAAVLAVGGAIIGSLFAAGKQTATIDSQLAHGTRPLTVVIALCLAPGLVVFLALRSLALAEPNWDECERCQVRLVLRCRAELGRVLALLGIFLTVLVIATGLRRRAVLAAEPAVDLPAEGVLLYGLIFAAQLGLFYALATSAIDRRAAKLLDELVPIPDPRAEDVQAVLGRRSAIATLLGQNGSWASFQSAVIIAAPLVTALISTATGK